MGGQSFRASRKKFKFDMVFQNFPKRIGEIWNIWKIIQSTPSSLSVPPSVSNSQYSISCILVLKIEFEVYVYNTQRYTMCTSVSVFSHKVLSCICCVCCTLLKNSPCRDPKFQEQKLLIFKQLTLKFEPISPIRSKVIVISNISYLYYN